MEDDLELRGFRHFLGTNIGISKSGLSKGWLSDITLGQQKKVVIS